MTGSYSKIFAFLIMVLAIVGGMLLTEDQQPLIVPIEEDEDLVAEREREERPNLYDYNQQELRDEARRKARRSYWRRQDYSQSDSDVYYYHHQYDSYNSYSE